MNGRKQIICEKCNKLKTHFGLNMCSACLRNYKRKTKPSFYLGTCYSEIKRRCKTFDSLRPNYFGKKYCTKEQFVNKFLKDNNFLKQYRLWQKSNFKRKFAPSVDRIDNTGDYTINNLQFISQSSNSRKDWQNKVEIIFCQKSYFYESQLKASNALKIQPSILCNLFKKNGNHFYYDAFEVIRYV